jgi:hypothetical protein
MVAPGSSAKHAQNDRKDSHRGNRSASNKKSRKTNLGSQSATVGGGATNHRVSSQVNFREENAPPPNYNSKRDNNNSIGSAKKQQ